MSRCSFAPGLPDDLDTARAAAAGAGHLGRRSLGIRQHAGPQGSGPNTLRYAQTSITRYTTIEHIGPDIMDDTVAVAAAIAAVSTLYATAGQAGGTAFLAVMAIATFPAGEMRPTSLLLNVVAASYATWRLHAGGAIDWNAVGRLSTASLPAAFVGGLIVLDARIYMILTGPVLILAGGLMVTRRKADTVGNRPMQSTPILMTGAGVGLLSGLTGVGGGVFLAPVLIFLGWASPRRAAGLSAPFILANSAIGLAGALLAGQRIADGVEIYAFASLVGAVIGTAIGLRWMSEAATRSILASILVFAGLRMLSL